MMNILLTNDDGYDALGIKILREKLAKYGHVIVVAPLGPMSAQSVAITITRPLSVRKIEDDVFALDGTPADCVSFGLTSLNVKFDVVISGCNDGFNISYDVLFSGTVGSCLQALTYRVPAIAMSADEGGFKVVEDNVQRVMDFILEKNLLSKEYLLNVNFPAGDIVKDIKLTHLYYREENSYFVHLEGDKYLAQRIINDIECKDRGSDVYEVYHHNVSITKLSKINYIKE